MITEPDGVVSGYLEGKIVGMDRSTIFSGKHRIRDDKSLRLGILSLDETARLKLLLRRQSKIQEKKAGPLEDSMGQADIAPLLREILFELRSLRQEMRAPVAAVSPEIRDLDIEEAKKEIKAYFEDHDGQDISPTQVARDLKLDLFQVIEACEKLFMEGRLEQK